MAKYITESKEQFKEELDKIVYEGFDLGLEPTEIDRMVEEAIAYATLEFVKEETFE